ncbi:hypothetical protein [Streptomyces sp. NPDC059165]|uniref:hypothetical protein n=1 Tax=Streptomyces sp. NPDC059165 TaxID=3346751 RepID=UPI0036B91364
MTVETWVQAGLALIGSAGGVVAARSARRTRRQERRDDFTVLKDALNERIDDLKEELDEQQEQITGQGAAIAWLEVDRRSLRGYIRSVGFEPPASKPIPDRARPFLYHIDL